MAGRLPDTDRRMEPDAQGRVRLMVSRAAMERTHAAAHAPDAGRTPSGQEPDAAAPNTVTLSVAYEGVIREQQARLLTLERELEHAHKREGKLLDALRAEQTLRVLSTGEPGPDGTLGGTTAQGSLWSRLRALFRRGHDP